MEDAAVKPPVAQRAGGTRSPNPLRNANFNPDKVPDKIGIQIESPGVQKGFGGSGPERQRTKKAKARKAKN